MPKPTVLAVALASGALVVAGCGSSDKSEAGRSSTTTPSTAARSMVSFVSPAAGASVSGPVKVKVKVKNFTLDAAAVGKKPQKGHGHLHFSMDGGKYDQPKYSGANGKLAVKLGVNGKYSPSVTPTITYTGLPKGKHELEVYLANNDHSNTGVESRISIKVGGSSAASYGSAAGDVVQVAMKDIAFTPKAVTAKVGQTITWVNDDKLDHNVTADSGAGFKSRAFGSGGRFSYTPTKPGIIRYECTLHPGMNGTITVK
jgi:plastocyanin